MKGFGYAAGLVICFITLASSVPLHSINTNIGSNNGNRNRRGRGLATKTST